MSDQRHIDFLLETLQSRVENAESEAGRNDGYFDGLHEAYSDAAAMAHQILIDGALVDDRISRIQRVLRRCAGKNLSVDSERHEVALALVRELRDI